MKNNFRIRLDYEWILDSIPISNLDSILSEYSNQTRLWVNFLIILDIEWIFDIKSILRKFWSHSILGETFDSTQFGVNFRFKLDFGIHLEHIFDSTSTVKEQKALNFFFCSLQEFQNRWNSIASWLMRNTRLTYCSLFSAC